VVHKCVTKHTEVFESDGSHVPYWATSAQGGVTRQGVVLTYLLSFATDSQ